MSTSHLYLPWLPVKSRIDFKVLLLTYKALNDQAPNYLKELVVPYCPLRPLRSQSAGLLVIPRISKTTKEAFSYRVPPLEQSPCLHPRCRHPTYIQIKTKDIPL